MGIAVGFASGYVAAPQEIIPETDGISNIGDVANWIETNDLTTEDYDRLLEVIADGLEDGPATTTTEN